jgi:hypothetical protein
MSNYSEDDFCTEDEGLDYIFVIMGSVYGASFNRHWDGMDLNMVRDVWKRYLKRFLTYKPSLDFALNAINKDFPPSAVAFKELCNQGPMIPVKPLETVLIERKMTIHEQIESDRIKAEALGKLAELRKQYGGRS